MGSEELTTAGGNLIKLKPDYTCIVYLGGTSPEIPNSNSKSMDQPIPRIVFIGSRFQIEHADGSILLFKNISGKIRLPYRLDGSDRESHIKLGCNSRSDEFPVQVNRFDTIKRFVGQAESGLQNLYLILDPSIHRRELVNLHLKCHDARILIVQDSSRPGKVAETGEIDSRNVRAADLVNSDKKAELTKNPVFLARIHLRNLEFDKVFRLLLDFRMQREELQFIRTFLQLMEKKGEEDQELSRNRTRIRNLSEIYRITSVLAGQEGIEFDKELTNGMAPDIAQAMSLVIKPYRMNAQSKEDEIRYWEWEHMLKKMSSQSVLNQNRPQNSA